MHYDKGIKMGDKKKKASKYNSSLIIYSLDFVVKYGLGMIL